MVFRDKMLSKSPLYSTRKLKRENQVLRPKLLQNQSKEHLLWTVYDSQWQEKVLWVKNFSKMAAEFNELRAH